MTKSNELFLKVAAKVKLTDDIVGLTLVSVSGESLPQWQPGSHIDLALNVGTDSQAAVADENIVLRQYSLCGDYHDSNSWQVAVLREDNGRGGSKFIHDQLCEGDTLKVSMPRNHFAFKPRKKCLFIAGGIGITPILPMIQQASAEGVDWRLVYLSRERNRMSFLDQLNQYDQSRIRLNGDKEDGFIDLPTLLATCDEYTSVYSCGPKPLLDALEAQHVQQSVWSLTIERFAGSGPVDITGKAFDVILNSTGERIRIPADKSILAVLREHGLKINSSCCDGVCGTCETAVLSGIPDHRDAILSEEERADNDYMMVCVSRALSSELVLDL